MIRQEIEKMLKDATGVVIKLERPLNPEHGDYAFNTTRFLPDRDPEDTLKKLKKFRNGAGKRVGAYIEFQRKNNFININQSNDFLQSQIGEILKQKDKFGQLDIGKSKKVQVEFISANPTGPLTLGNGRGGFCGDVLANVLEMAGFEVEREYYVNDRGEQVIALGHSVLGDDKGVYQGDYITLLRKELAPSSDASKAKNVNVEEIGQKAAEYILDKMIKPTVKRMGIKYDVWFSEKGLYAKRQVEKAIERLKKEGLTYQKEGALWFKSTKFGDDKDRVLVKGAGGETYLTSDLAYFADKMDRGFDLVINLWGADHHGYVARFEAMINGLLYDPSKWKVILFQLVKLFKDGKEVRMSKRAGVYVTLDELLDEVSLDAARWFFLTRNYNTHLNFDINLAKEQSEKNPVYYVQYAHARICSILSKRKAESEKLKATAKRLKLLEHPSELALIKQLIKLPEAIEDTASDYQVQRLPKYAHDLAALFHKFYTDCRVIDEKNQELTQARLALVKAAQIVLKNVLTIMGIKAPEKM